MPSFSSPFSSSFVLSVVLVDLGLDDWVDAHCFPELVYLFIIYFILLFLIEVDCVSIKEFCLLFSFLGLLLLRYIESDTRPIMLRSVSDSAYCPSWLQ